MCGSWNEVKLFWVEREGMFGKTCYFLFLRGLLGKEQKMNYLTALSIDCLGGYCLNDIRVLNGSQLRVYSGMWNG